MKTNEFINNVAVELDKINKTINIAREERKEHDKNRDSLWACTRELKEGYAVLNKNIEECKNVLFSSSPIQKGLVFQIPENFERLEKLIINSNNKRDEEVQKSNAKRDEEFDKLKNLVMSWYYKIIGMSLILGFIMTLLQIKK